MKFEADYRRSSASAACGQEGELRRDREGDQAQDLAGARCGVGQAAWGKRELGRVRARDAGAYRTRKQEVLGIRRQNKMLDELIGRYKFPVPETFVSSGWMHGWSAGCGHWQSKA